MKKILCGAILFASVVVAGSVLAADLSVKASKAPPPPPAVNWTGLYVGGHVGYIWGATTVQDNGVVTDSNAPTNGVVGGVLAGAAWQNGPLVFGAEGDFGWSDAHGNGIAVAVTDIIETPNTYKINSTSHIRGLLGYAAGQWLIFVAGGVAFSDFTFHDSQDIIERRFLAPGGIFTGGSIGGGIAYALTDRIAARAEYLYDDFGHKNYAGVDGDAYRVGLTGQTFRGAITLKLQ